MSRLSLLLVSLALLCVLPFLVLAFYSHAALDDYSISVVLRSVKLLPYIWNAYLTHSGRYSASLFSAVFLLFGAHPGSYQYQIAAFIFLFALSLYWVATTLAAEAGYAAAGQRVLPGSLVLIAGFSAYPWPAEGFFWLTGAQAYLSGLILSCWLLSLLTWLYAAPKGRWQGIGWGLCGVCGFLIPGVSEILALLLGLVIVALLLTSKVWPARWQVYWVVAACLAGSLATLAAPGNFVRLHEGGSDMHIGRSVLLAGVGTGYLLVGWVGNGVLLVLTMLLWPLSRVVAQHTEAKPVFLNRLTQHRALWPVLLVVGLFGCMLFCYLSGGSPALRVKNLLYLYFLLCWSLSTHAFMRHYGLTLAGQQWPRPVYYGLGVALLCFFCTDHNGHLTHDNIGRGYNTVVQAYRDWLSGDAARYHNAQLARYRLVRANPPGGRVVLPLLPVLPLTVFYADISYNPALWGNQAYAQFYGQRQVWVQPPGAPMP